MTYGDPQEVHGCECVKCGAWQADSWEDVDNAGWCHECIDAEGDEENESVMTPRTDWFAVAKEVVL